ncbi:MAG: phage protease, partial [Verrucomicrobiota bacterium]
MVQVIDDAAANSIVNRFNADADANKLRHGHEMLIDHEHFSDQLDKETRAYGWLQELKNRADGIYGRIHWTATGKKAVDGGDYRFFSTEYDPEDLQLINREGGKAKLLRPLRLAGLTLTNMNNNRGQKPITVSNRSGEVSGAALPFEKSTIKTAPQSSRFPCVGIFGAMVAIVKNRTGSDYSSTFNRMLPDNRDLLRGQIDTTNHTGPLLRLLN